MIEAKGEAFKGKLLGVLNAVLKTQKMALGSKSAETPEKVVLRRNTEPVRSRNKLVALACSTGGPKALQSVIPYLPKIWMHQWFSAAYACRIYKIHGRQT